MNTISILGCGWLGLPLAYRLLQEGYTVKGSTTKAEKLPSLKELSIAPYLIQLNPEVQGQKAAEFLSSDVLILNIPPQVHRHGPDFHPQQIQALLQSMVSHPNQHVIYTSSTSVYPDEGENLTEEAAHPHAAGANQTLLKAEALLQEALGERLTILRFGGLMGYDRISGKWSKGQEIADSPVNYLHRDDAVEIVLQVLKKKKWGQVYNAVAPQHPGRAAIYQKNAAAHGWPAATFTAAESVKTISAKKLQEDLAYTFLHPNPLDFPTAAN